MATKDFFCTLNFDDIDLARPEIWRAQLIDLVQDEAFSTLLSDLTITGGAIAAAPTAREWGGGCDVHADVHSGGGGSAGISCGIHF